MLVSIRAAPEIGMFSFRIQFKYSLIIELTETYSWEDIRFDDASQIKNDVMTGKHNYFNSRGAVPGVGL